MAKEFHRFVLLAATLILIWAPCIFPAEILTGQPLVVIDPGHDNAGPGLESESGDREPALTLALAERISAFLSDTCRVHLTRTSANQPLETGGTELANREKADLFLSLHLHNKKFSQPVIYVFSLPEESGGDTWQNRAVRYQAPSRKLALTLAAALKEAVAAAPLILSGPVLPLEGLNMPGILAEPFALSQVPPDPDKRKSFVNGQARIIADALLAFLEDTKATR